MLQQIARMLGWTPLPGSGSSPLAAIAATPPPGLAVARHGDVGMPQPLDADALRASNRKRAIEIARRNYSTTER